MLSMTNVNGGVVPAYIRELENSMSENEKADWVEFEARFRDIAFAELTYQLALETINNNQRGRGLGERSPSIAKLIHEDGDRVTERYTSIIRETKTRSETEHTILVLLYPVTVQWLIKDAITRIPLRVIANWESLPEVLLYPSVKDALMTRPDVDEYFMASLLKQVTRWKLFPEKLFNQFYADQKKSVVSKYLLAQAVVKTLVNLDRNWTNSPTEHITMVSAITMYKGFVKHYKQKVWDSFPENAPDSWIEEVIKTPHLGEYPLEEPESHSTRA